MYSDYDAYARVYDRVGDQYRHVGLRRFVDYVAAKVEEGSRILDLCCGSGYLVADLRSTGYVADGIDASAVMVDIARTKCTDASFDVADARWFATSDRYDAVLCFGDSLNHVLEPNEMLCVFRNAFAALVAGGVFAFDLNTSLKHERCDGTEVHVFDDLVGIHRARYDGERRMAISDITVFEERGGQWRRTDTQLLQRSYPWQDIEALLRQAGFRDVEVIGIAPAGATVGQSEKILFIAGN